MQIIEKSKKPDYDKKEIPKNVTVVDSYIIELLEAIALKLGIVLEE